MSHRGRFAGAVPVLAAGMALAAGALIGPTADAGEWGLSGSVAGELRVFPHEAAIPERDDTAFSPSFSLEPEVVYEWNDGDGRLTLVPFLRWDADDDNRSHGDLRVANWLHIGDAWDLVVGIDRVFWGVVPPLGRHHQ